MSIINGTMTDDLLQMTAMLKERGIEMTAMESTGSFWKPIFNILEVEGLAAILVNAQHIKNVPGRKTDVKDAEWIADLLRHGLLKASFVKPRDQRELNEYARKIPNSKNLSIFRAYSLCELIRYRTSLIEERAREYNRIDKVLEGANIKLTSVASSIETASGMSMVKALSEGVVDADVLASMAQGSMRSKIDDLKRAMNGLIQPHQQMMLKTMLTHIDEVSKLINLLDAEIAQRMRSEVELIESLDEISGVGKVSAQTVIAELGTNMDVFPSEHH